MSSFDRTAEFVATEERKAAAFQKSYDESCKAGGEAFEKAKKLYPEQLALLRNRSTKGWVEMRDGEGQATEAPEGTFFLVRPDPSKQGEGWDGADVLVKLIDDSAKPGFEELLRFSSWPSDWLGYRAKKKIGGNSRY